MLRQECPGRKIDRNIAKGNVATRLSWQEQRQELCKRNIATRMTWLEKRQEHRKRKCCNKNVVVGTRTGTLQ
jgi:hypothetical protein